MDRDNLFDKKVKQKLQNEVNSVPDNINKAFDLGKLEVSKIKKKSYRKVASIVGVLLSITLLLSISISPYAKKIPILRDINQFLTPEDNLEYKNYGEDLNLTVEDKGIGVTLHKVLYDGIDLQIVYSVEVDGEIDEQFSVDPEIFIDGKSRDAESLAMGGLYENNGIYIMNVRYGFLSQEFLPKDNKYKYSLPDEFLLSFKIDRIVFNKDNIVKGNWEIEVPIENKIDKDDIYKEELEVDLSNIQKDLVVNKFISTPVNTLIQTTSSYSGNNILNFMVFDENGKEIRSTSSSGYLYKKSLFKDGHFAIHKFEGVENTKSLYIIPWVRKFGGGKLNELEVKLNFQGKTELKTKDGKYYGEITKIEVIDGKTRLYYKPAIGNTNILREIYKTNNKEDKVIEVWDGTEEITERYIKETGEFMLEFNKEIKEDEYTLMYYDSSKFEIVYHDKAFQVEIQK